MTLKERMKQYNFWISLVSAVLLVARILGTKFGFEIDSSLVMDVTTGLCGVFVVLGIISAPQKVVTKIQTEFKQPELSEPIVKPEPVIETTESETKVETGETSSEETCEETEAQNKNADILIEFEDNDNEQIAEEEVKIEGETVAEINPKIEENQSTDNLDEMNKEDLINLIQTLKNN